MEKELLETFVTVSKTQNISKAAQEMYLTQAAVSRRLKELEGRLGVSLIVRQKGVKRTELTSAGRQFLPLAEQWLALDRNVDDFRYEKLDLELTIGAVNSINNYFLRDFFRMLKNDSLRWRLRVRTLHSGEMYDMARRNLIDIGFPQMRMELPNVYVKKVHEDRLLVVTRDPALGKTSLLPEDLDEDRQIFIDWGADYRRWHHAHFFRGHVPRFAVDSVKMAFDYLDEKSWFFAPHSVCVELQREEGVYVAGLITSPMRELFMISERVNMQAKRREFVLFKWRFFHYVRRKEREIMTCLPWAPE